MKNIPEKIYLQIGEEEIEPDYDFNKLGEVSWCSDKIFPSDIEYVLAKNSEDMSWVDEMYDLAKKAVPDHYADLGEGTKLNTGKFLRKKWIEGFEAGKEWQANKSK